MCFDQLEFLIGAAVCLEMQTTPSGKPDEHAVWPLYGSTHLGLKLDTADSITFRAELDFSGEHSLLNLLKFISYFPFRSRTAIT